MGKKRRQRPRVSENISFRITKEELAALQIYADGELDQHGRPLTLGQAARKMVLAKLLADGLKK